MIQRFTRAIHVWRLHVLLALIAAVQCIAFVVLHQDEKELLVAFYEGDQQERLDALHIIANRGEVRTSDLGQRRVEQLLQDPDPLLRESVFTNEVCKIAPSHRQRGRLEILGQRDLREDAASAEWWIAMVLHTRKVGGPEVGTAERLALDELRWFLDAKAGRTLPIQKIKQHLSRLR